MKAKASLLLQLKYWMGFRNIGPGEAVSKERGCGKALFYGNIDLTSAIFSLYEFGACISLMTYDNLI